MKNVNELKKNINHVKKNLDAEIAANGLSKRAIFLSATYRVYMSELSKIKEA